MKAITITRTRIPTSIGIAAAIITLFALLSPTFGAPLRAQGLATVRPEPAALALQSGEVADVAIRLENASDVYGIDVRAAFDPAIVEIVDADPATDGVQMFEGAFPQPDFVALNAADNAAGTLRYVVTQVNPTPPATGAGVVFSFQVRARAGGATDLAIALVEMSDRDGNLLAVTPGAAAIQVTGPTAAPTGIVMQPTVAATAAPGEATSIAPTATGAAATGATATTAPAGEQPTAAPPAAATGTAASDAAGTTAAPPAGATQPAPANPPAAGESTAAPGADAATIAPIEGQPATAAPTAPGGESGTGGETPAAASAAATTVSPVIIGEAAGGQTGAPADTSQSSDPAHSGLTNAALLVVAVVALLIAGIAIARLRRRG
jgi:hypothetical protein